MPETFKLSNSVWPSTSKSLVTVRFSSANIFPVKAAPLKLESTLVAIICPLTFNDPLTSNFACGFVVPIPTLSLARNGANCIVPSASTSILGVPLISFTENMEPDDKLFVTENNWPSVPTILKAVVAEPTFTSNSACGFVVPIPTLPSDVMRALSCAFANPLLAAVLNIIPPLALAEFENTSASSWLATLCWFTPTAELYKPPSVANLIYGVWFSPPLLSPSDSRLNTQSLSSPP